VEGASNSGAGSSEAPDTRPAVLEPALWQRLNEAQSIEDLALAWLVLQCRMIPGVERGLVRVDRGGQLETLCNWPEQGAVLTELLKTADLAVVDRRAVARGTRGVAGSVAVPIMIGERIAAVVALGLTDAGKDEMRDAIRQLQWGSAWLRDQLRRQQADAEGAQLDRSRVTIDLIATILEHERFAVAVTAAATDLAMRLQCSRASIGFVRSGNARVAAISHTAQFGRRMNLIRLIGNAMDEAIDQRAIVLYPSPGDDPIATLAHADLALQQQGGHVLTVPLFVVDAFIGAITLERPPGSPFDRPTVELADVVATAIGPILDEKRRNDRWIAIKIWESLATQVKRLLGPGHIGRKLGIAGTLALVTFFYFAHDTYRVSADAQLDGAERRQIVSPYEGYLQSADVRAGETVKAGDLLAALDDRDLVLERLRWETQRQQFQIELDQALAARQPAAANAARSRIAQAEAQTRLIDEQIARTRFVAPFDGLVISGDQSQRIGSAISRGEVLFEIAPLTGYRVIIEVDERQIADIAPGQIGEVVFSALPNMPFDLTVDKIVPIAQARDGRNTFRVEARLTETSESLRPGMIGVGKVDIGDLRLIEIWMRPAIAWAELAVWRLFG
jgi:RND family efflux transporter MFP subunit